LPMRGSVKELSLKKQSPENSEKKMKKQKK